MNGSRTVSYTHLDVYKRQLLEGAGWDGTRNALLELICRTADGAPTRGEARGYREIAIFKDGVTL